MAKSKKNIKSEEQLMENPYKSEEKEIVMTDSEIAQKYHLDEHSWEGTVAIWKIKKELGIK